MNKLVWIGIAAVAAVLLFTWWMYSTFIDSRVALQTGSSRLTTQQPAEPRPPNPLLPQPS
jgi:hypothetical protein